MATTGRCAAASSEAVRAERRRHETAERRRALFEEAVSVIEHRYHDEGLTIGGLSRHVFASRRQLQRSFADAGTSVRERLHAVRMERAAALLRESSLPVAQVARSVGYREPAQFAKAFRRYYDVAPAEWRKGAAHDRGTTEPTAIKARRGCGSPARSHAPKGERRLGQLEPAV